MSGKSLAEPARVDRRAARTRRLLHEALMRLIFRKDYDSITVQDLLDEADIGRSTFYAHYAGRDDLLRKGFDRLQEELRAAQDRLSGDGSAAPLAFSAVVFAHTAAYRENYRAMVGTRGGSIVLAEVRRVLLSMVEPELDRMPDGGVPRDLLARYIVDAFHSVLTWWLERRPQLAPEEVDRMFRRLVLAPLKLEESEAGLKPGAAATVRTLIRA